MSASTGTVYRRLLGYTPWFAFFLSLFGFLLYSIANVSVVQLVSYLVDSLQGNAANLAEVKAVLSNWLGISQITDQWLVPAAIILIVLVRGIGTFLGTYYIQFAANQMVFELRQQVFDQFLTLPSAYYDQHASGHLVAKVTYHVSQVTGAATDAVKIIFREGLTVVGYLGFLLYLNWRLTLLFLIAAPLIGLLARVAGRRFRRISERIQDSMGDVTQVAAEAIQGYREVRTFGGEQYERDRFRTVSERNRSQSMKMVLTSAVATPVIQLLVSTVLAGLVWLLLEPVIRSDMTTGDVVAFITTGGLLAKPIRQLTEVIAIVQKGIAAAADLFQVLDESRELDQGTTQLGIIKGNIRFDKVSFRYETAPEAVLHEIDFSIRRGETIALVGPSGGGKTTLASLIARFYEPTEGAIYIDDVPIQNIRRSDLRRNLAIVSQSVTLFNDSVARNIAYGGLADASADSIRAAAADAQALEFIDQLPQGLNTIVGDNGVLLSGGQRQRLAIARALLKDAPLLILDEATSALDTESERAFQAALERLIEGRTTIIIAHRLSTVEKADRIFVLVDGKIVEKGTHQSLLSQGAHYARYFEQQSGMVSKAESEEVSEGESTIQHPMPATKSTEQWVLEGWYGAHAWTKLLIPVSWLYRGLSFLRRHWLKRRVYKPSVPVVVVGNLVVGGTGKTPVVAEIARQLKLRGFNPGIVSRGYKGRLSGSATLVSDQSTALEVGDEVIMLRDQLGLPIAIGKNRPEAVKLLERFCNVIIADDGLQRYDLARTFEVAVVDGVRHMGNGQLLPAGPLREGAERLGSVDLVLINESEGANSSVRLDEGKECTFHLTPSRMFDARSGEDVPLARLAGASVHAVAAIGHPERFGSTLESLGASVLPRYLGDHHLLTERDLTFADQLPVVMTEKDFARVGAQALALLPIAPWVLSVRAELPEHLINFIVNRIGQDPSEPG